MPRKLDQDLTKFCLDNLQLKSLDDLKSLKMIAHDMKGGYGRIWLMACVKLLVAFIVGEKIVSKHYADDTTIAITKNRVLMKS